MRKFKVLVNGVSYNVEVEEESVVVSAVPAAPAVTAPAVQAPAVPAAPAAPAPAAAVAAPVKVEAGATAVNAPMPGKITKIIAKAGDAVKKGNVLMLLEAMKMQNEIVAPADGTVKSVNVAAGQGVKPGDVLAVIG